VTGLGKGKAETLRLLGEEAVRRLNHDAGAVAHQGIGAYGAAMLEVDENLQPVLDDAVRLFLAQVDDEANAAGIAVVLGIVETLERRAHAQPGRLERALHDGPGPGRSIRCRAGLDIDP